MFEAFLVRSDVTVVAAGVTEELVDCSGGDDFSPEGVLKRKLEALDVCMARHPVPRTIIFCNRIETCRAVENHLKRKDRAGKQVKPLAVHAAIAAEQRTKNLAAFLYPPQEGEPARVLVCTDRCASMLSFQCLCTSRVLIGVDNALQCIDEGSKMGEKEEKVHATCSACCDRC
jgi:superfamily II DNA/RNA helicase